MVFVVLIAAYLSQDLVLSPQDPQFFRDKADSSRSLESPQTREIEKVAVPVREALTGDQRRRVILVLRDQPQKQLYSEIAARHLQSIEAAKSPSRLEPEPTTLVDDLLLESRRETALALERAAGQTQEDIVALLQSLGASAVRRYPLMNAIRAEIPASALGRLEIDDRIAEIGLVESNETQISVSSLWTGAPRFWSGGFTGSGESVLILDSGVKASHPAFTGRVSAASYVENNPTCSAQEKASADDFNGHGTHVAGIVAASAIPNRGVAHGLGRVFSAKISCAGGVSFTDDMLEAVNRALLNTTSSIINNSNGSRATADDDFLSRQIDSLVDTYNLTWINSAGNEGLRGERTVTSPAIAYNVISVGNADIKRSPERNLATIAPTSSRGPTVGGRAKPDLVAPGHMISSTDFAGVGFVTQSGTSMAAPHVAGAAALLRQAGIRDRLRIKALLINSASEGLWASDRGWGYLNLDRAFNERQSMVTGTIAPERFSGALYRVTAEPGKLTTATLTWSRYLTGGASFLRDLDLYVFGRSSGLLIDASKSTNDNVEQVIFQNPFFVPIELVVRIDAFDQGTLNGQALREPFALAISAGTLTPIQGPRPSIQCTPPASVNADTRFSFDCVFTNAGDLPVVAGTAVLAASGRELSRVEVGAVSILGGVVKRTFVVSSSGAPGPLPLTVTLQGVGYYADPPPVSFVVSVIGASPPPVITSVVHGASFLPEIAEATWVTIRGTNLASTTRTWNNSDFRGTQLPQTLDGVSVSINGRRALVQYISPTQVNALAPTDSVVGNVAVQVTNAAGASLEFQARKAALSPAFFTFAAGGKTYAAAVHADGFYVAPEGIFGPSVASRPAKPGDTIMVFGSGCGPSTPPMAAETLVPGAAPLASVSEISIGGVAATVAYAGIVGSGLCQFNVVVPQVPAGDHATNLSVGRVTSTFRPPIPVSAP